MMGRTGAESQHGATRKSYLFTSIEKWLKKRRDEYPNNDPHEQPSASWLAIDNLLDEFRTAGVEGWFPWERLPDDDS